MVPALLERCTARAWHTAQVHIVGACRLRNDLVHIGFVRVGGRIAVALSGISGRGRDIFPEV